MASDVIYIGADHNVSYTGARNALTGAYFNAGTCAWTLADSTGATVATGSLAYQSGTNGNYYGTIDAAVTETLEQDAPYTVTITFSQAGYDDERVLNVRAAYRTTT